MFDPSAPRQNAVKVVLNAGSGPPSPRRLYPGFGRNGWREVTLDIDPAAQTDYVGSVTDMRALFQVGIFDAIWSSHNIEHLHAHEVVPALQEFCRVLKPNGFALVTCPDLEAAVAKLLSHGLDHQVYTSPAGPITVRDMIFGYGHSIASGNRFMAHNTGFTCESLGRAALDAGFAEARVGSGSGHDLWAAFLMPHADEADVRACLAAHEVAILFPPPET